MKLHVLIGMLVLLGLMVVLVASLRYTARLGKDAALYQSVDGSVKTMELAAGNVVTLQECVDTGSDIFFRAESEGGTGYLFELRNQYSIRLSAPWATDRVSKAGGLGASISCLLIVSRFRRMNR